MVFSRKLSHVSLTIAKPFIGKKVTLHLQDGSVLINVHLKSIINKRQLEVVTPPHRKTQLLLLRDIVSIEAVSPYLALLQGGTSNV